MISSGGDGIDSNGNINLIEGSASVRSASEGGEAGIDYDGQLYISDDFDLNNGSGVAGPDGQPGGMNGGFGGMNQPGGMDGGFGGMNQPGGMDGEFGGMNQPGGMDSGFGGTGQPGGTDNMPQGPGGPSGSMGQPGNMQ